MPQRTLVEQLCPESTVTLRQLAGFARAFGTAEPFGLTGMSAAVSGMQLHIVDNPELGDPLRIEDEQRAGELAVRLAAARTVQRLPVEPGDYQRWPPRCANAIGR